MIRGKNKAEQNEGAKTRQGASLLLLLRALPEVFKASPALSLLSFLLALVQGTLPLVMLYLVKVIIDTLTNGLAANDPDLFKTVLLWLLVMWGCIVARVLCDELTQLISETQDILVADHMLGIVHRKAVQVDMAFYEDAQRQDTFHRALQEASVRPLGVANHLVSLVRIGVSLSLMIGVLISFHWAMPLLLLLGSTPLVLVNFIQGKRLFRWEQDSTAAERRCDYYHSILTGAGFARELRLYGLGDEITKRFREARRILRKQRFAIGTRRVAMSLGAGFVAGFFILGALSWMIASACSGAITVGALIMLIQAAQQAQSTTSSFLSMFSVLYQDALYLSNLYTFLELEPMVVAPAAPTPAPDAVCQDIVFEDVSFKYPNSKKLVLKHLNFRIPARRIVVVVGENGSGKTTIVKLLSRLYDPDKGRILLDGVDFKSFDPAALRSRMVVLSQDFVRFQLTVRENIWLGDCGRPRTDPAAILAAQRAGIHEEVESLSLAYDTLLGRLFESGHELSGGQWQKLALARALFREASVVILDEPSSAMDPRADYEFSQRVREMLAGRTAFIVSHRLALARAADWIIVLKHGKIIEQGHHNDLHALGGLYYSMFTAQAEAYV